MRKEQKLQTTSQRSLIREQSNLKRDYFTAMQNVHQSEIGIPINLWTHQPRGSSSNQPRGSSSSQPRGSSSNQSRGSSSNQPRGNSSNQPRGCSSTPTLQQQHSDFAAAALRLC